MSWPPPTETRWEKRKRKWRELKRHLRIAYLFWRSEI